MPVTLTTLGGMPAVVIPDSRGKPSTYLFTVLPASGLAWRVRLEKVECARVVADYKVTLFPRGGWSCECRDAYYRRKKCNEEGGCKHTLCARELRKVLRAVRLAEEEWEAPDGRDQCPFESGRGAV